MHTVTPVRQLLFLRKLFFTRKFITHRVGGLAFLIQFAAAFILYFANYEAFLNSFLIWSLPATGLFQSVSAIYSFSFLAKHKIVGGYFGDKAIMSYEFVVENSFYAMILLLQWLYYHDTYFGYMGATVVLEQLFVFFPYAFRKLWPSTSFRDAMKSNGNKSVANIEFYIMMTQVTKAFYIWAKHFIGFFLNYARFMHRIDDTQ
ncbi:hypothetical protein HDU67_009889, partial [Dinochytrium kinnereticum]